MKNVFNNSSGLTLVEILMVMALVAILTTASLTAMDRVSEDLAFDKTYGKMLRIKTALIGDLDANKQGLRDYYGYIGDIGALPSTLQGLQALLARPSGVSAWAVNTTSKTGMGWRGPYLPETTGNTWLRDAWGTAFVYSNVAAATPYIRSCGLDRVCGGTNAADDLQIDFTSNLTHSTVSGIINTNGSRYDGNATINLYYPNGSGALRTETITITSAANGFFTFSSVLVPFGVRSFRVTTDADTIGPAIVSIDESIFLIPNNFLDSSPGALPHTCANVNKIRVVPGSKGESTALNRIYFDLDIDESINIKLIYLQVDNGSLFEGLRIGNQTMNCDGPAATGLKCMDYNILGFFGAEDTSVPYDTDPANFPEIATSDTTNGWTIPSGTSVGAYVELSSITSLTRIDLRIACNLLRIE